MSGAIYAFSGKGGSGKTTLAAMTVRHLIAMDRKPVLAVDADPNATLGLALGEEVSQTIADLRDRMGQAAQRISEIPKDRLMDQWLAEVLTEGVGFDLLTMGRPEGPRCYCYVNGLLRRYLKELRGNYPAVVVDCEAGMEYLSRLTVDDVDTLVLVAEATQIGLTSARRVGQLADALPIQVHRRILAVNKIGLSPAAGADEPIEGLHVDATVRVPFDMDLYSRTAQGRPVAEDGGEAWAAAEQIAHLCASAPGQRIT